MPGSRRATRRRAQLKEEDVRTEEPVRPPIEIRDRTDQPFDRDAFLLDLAPPRVSDKAESAENEAEPRPDTPEKEEATEVKAEEAKKTEEDERTTEVTDEEEKESESPTTPEEAPVPSKKRLTKKVRLRIVEEPASMVQIRDIPKQRVKDVLPVIKASPYYLANREIFLSSINARLRKYRLGRDEDITCEDRGDDGSFKPMPHQELVRDYLAAYTPYRGLLLYHGLGSGKTCSSIGIAEGLKGSKPIFVMMPASLRTNYIEELKKCGDELVRKDQHWIYIEATDRNVGELSDVTGLPEAYIRKEKGAWVVDPAESPNYADLTSDQQKALNKQLLAMLETRYTFLNYNGMRLNNLRVLSDDFTRNPFDGCVVIVDEAHNLVSRIVNKLNKPDSLSMRLYEYLMDARDAKIIALSGTPIINYPNELGILFNILRGRISAWTFNIQTEGKGRVDSASIKALLKPITKAGAVADYVEYNPSRMEVTITRNPYGFVNETSKGVYKGVRLGSRGQVSDETFIDLVVKQLKKAGLPPVERTVKADEPTRYKALPDTLEEFSSFFIRVSGGSAKLANAGLFTRRILGLTSYFKDMEGLMPRFRKATDFHVEKIQMSDFQFGVYEEARIRERKEEADRGKKAKRSKAKKRAGGNEAAEDLYGDTTSTYRIFSRAFCNFVFPRPDIVRPMPGLVDDPEVLRETAKEDMLDAVTGEELAANPESGVSADEALETSRDQQYEESIQAALSELEKRKDEFLSPKSLEMLSPKYLKIIQNLKDPNTAGKHLIYSQFRTLEGIGVLALALEANGFRRFRLKKTASGYTIDVAKGSGPVFALYTGTESAEEKEIVRNIFNGDWQYVSPSLAKELEAIAESNDMGEVIQTLMITASGAEGISLKSVRYVHITEPYWHPVRLTQVIGRARRICSHMNLPRELQTVEVFLYLMTFSPSQLDSDESIELRLKDTSRIDGRTPVTSDEHLFEIANAKENVANQLLEAIRDASIDCLVSTGKDNNCFKFGHSGPPNPNKFASVPSLSLSERDDVVAQNQVETKWKPREIELRGQKYIQRMDTGELYDYDAYKEGKLLPLGAVEEFTDTQGVKKLRVKLYQPDEL